MLYEECCIPPPSTTGQFRIVGETFRRLDVKHLTIARRNDKVQKKEEIKNPITAKDDEWIYLARRPLGSLFDVEEDYPYESRLLLEVPELPTKQIPNATEIKDEVNFVTPVAK